MRCWFACLAFFVAQAQAPLPEDSLLQKVKARAEENLKRLPNYTCTETIERWLRLGPKARLRHQDTIRLDVAYLEGKEWFGRPGQGKLDQDDVAKVADGTLGNGQFALFVKSIFVGGGSTFSPATSTKLEGRQVFRFEYAVPLEHSGFRMESSTGSAVVGYSGSFWVARDTLDLIRLAVSGVDLPPGLHMASDVTTTDYGQVSIGGSLFLLPLRSTYDARDIYGSQARNVTVFENCHEFVGESVVKFGGP
jgi:hypothetical protein